MGLAVTDAIALPDGRLLLSAAAEDSPNAVDDGPVVATALVLVDGYNVTLATRGELSLADQRRWLVDAVGRADPVRRLEGLLVPGLYEVEPGRSAVEVLQALLATSTARLEATGCRPMNRPGSSAATLWVRALG